MKVSIIIVNYKVKIELFVCLASLKDIRISHEVIVVDNDEEKSIQKEINKKFPYVKYIPNEINNGYGGGNNLGASFAKGEYIFFLNPDTVVHKDCIENLSKYLDNNRKIAIVAPLLLNPQTKKPYPLQGAQELTPLRAIVALSFLNKFFPDNPVSYHYFLKDWNKKEIKKVDTIPGTAFMIRKSIFDQVNGFDENFFLYFEEHDICNRIKKLGYNIVILPQAQIIHAWGKSTEKSNANINEIFKKSKFYYFKKNYGWFWALLVKLITEISKNSIILIGILLLATFLRFYRLQQNFGFDAEIGDNLLDIKNAILTHTIPLKGPPTSHPWLSFGPLFYWIYGPILWLSHFNPLSHAYFGAILGITTLIFNYIFFKKLFSKQISLISTFIMTISPMYMFTSHIGRFTFFVPILIYPFLWIFKQILDKKSANVFLLFFLLGLMFNFHYTPLFLIPVVIAGFIIKKIWFSLKQILISIIGFVIPNIPLLIYDGMHNFSMLKNLTLWIPYRILGFLGLYHKNTVNQLVLKENGISFKNFFVYSFLPLEKNPIITNLSIILLSICVGLLLFMLVQIIRKKEVFTTNWLIIFLWSFFGFLALFIHGDVPLHYFVPLFPLPILLLSFFLIRMSKTLPGKIIAICLLIAITLLNLQFYFSSNWFYTKDTKTLAKNGGLTYKDLQEISKYIIKDAYGRAYVLHRVGYNDLFEKQYAQNYIYLLWWYGNEPVQKSSLSYTIVEDGSRLKATTQKKSQISIIANTYIIKNNSYEK